MKSQSATQTPSTSSKSTPVDGICKVTTNPTKCAKVLTPLLSGSSTDPASVLNLIIDTASKNVKIAASVTDRAKNAPSIPEEMSEPLRICSESYAGVIANLVKSQDVKAVNGALSGSIASINACDKSFADHPHNRSPVKEIDATIVELLGYGVDISKSLIK
ncbi:uncharacterized protein LOC126681441 [Mercurialis annua]|uniref:uncharacterized protein LOC126681441 n=1 Tax=Mercurialis annua TaxID=3986 RepID=UPI00215FB190|nr:uncharacterized protein LOC126681441 [Mercurialis annua]